ncbi:unnamed protein product [Cryptosporidium hominis]|uniref:Uncharacterized protein n=1 Tax=Cryptosporidium hominis TaxID=237895 RepID=A0A0S4TJR2_CRYHO|nr:hypothetical protein ChTU502y2012_407g2465 [Cryptosporidium hominis]PPA65924.1 hypothetical protein ChUKH1_15260 [Cryptosporidium hominis]PPS95770.1 Uncharacterized protein GY17_00002384 [Cryptosporidium hominis]CUV07487.1 unnamed protein product [Cryptosporidium hominis]|eukprot:PPS95770.1 Uncharacterized protein GY17_00002384 [Cryptosporidium hominis]
MQVGSLGKDDRSLSFKEVYGEKLGSFLEAKETCYKSWNRSDSPEKFWKLLQEEKENYLSLLVSTGLRFSEEVQNEVDWRNMLDLLEKSELSFEYPFSLPFKSTYESNFDSSASNTTPLICNQFSPKWGIHAGKSAKTKIDPRRVGEKSLKKAPFEMDERQWKFAGYEVVLLSIDFIRRNIGELKLQITRLEESKMKIDRLEEQYKATTGGNRITGSGIQTKSSNIPEEKNQHYHFSKICTEQGIAYEKLQSLHSKLTRDCDNLISIYKSLMMFSEMVRIKFAIDSSTEYIICSLLSKFDSGGMGFFTSQDIHPLETRYRVLLLLESWSKSDLLTCNYSTWDHGKMRIKPGGAPRIIPEITHSKVLKDEPEFRSWIHRQIHIIYSNLALKLQRLVLFIPPGWLQYLPGEIDLRDMLDLRNKSWSYSSRNIGLGIQKELLSEGAQKTLGKNPQYLLEFTLESITILDQLRNLFDQGFWGDSNFLKAPENLNNGRDLLNRLLQLMSAMERLDLAIRRDISNNSLKSVPSTFHINLSSYCIEMSSNDKKYSLSFNLEPQNKLDGHVYTSSNSQHIPSNSNSSHIESKKQSGHINRRQLIYTNEFVRDSIEERLLVLPNLSSYWMLESQILHILIRTLMSVNVNSIDPNSGIKGIGLTSMGLHQYSPFISRCIVFIGYMLENGIYVDEDLEYMDKVTITKTNIIPTSLDTYSLYLASCIWVCYENFLSIKNLKSVSGLNLDYDHESPIGIEGSGLSKIKDKDQTSIQEVFFSVLDLILKDLPSFLKYQTISSLEQELTSSSQSLKNAYFTISSQPIDQRSINAGTSETLVSKDTTKQSSGSNIRSRFHSNSRELLRKITNNSKDVKEGGSLVEKSSYIENKEDELDEDFTYLNRFYKINSFIIQIQGRKTNNISSNLSSIISQPILRQNDQLWKSPDWMICLRDGISKGIKNKNNKEDTLNDQFWRIFGISLTTSSRSERVYGEILIRRLSTLSFRSRILCLCQSFFKLEAPGILRKLLQIISRMNTCMVLEEDDSLSLVARRAANMAQIGSDKRLWTRYCNYCILRSNELKIRELFEIPMQMLKLPATHYVELKLRLNSKDLRDSEEKERMERLARQEIQGCLETFINAFRFLEDTFISETITSWSRVMYEGASLTAGGGSISLVRDYVLITVRLLEVYAPYYMEELMNSEYWDLLMISRSQFEDLVSSIIGIDKYMVILKNWLEFNLDSIKIQSRIIDAQMIYNQINNVSNDYNSQLELRLQEMMRRRYMNDHLQQVTLFNLFSPQFILLIQNRINNIEYLVYKVYQDNKDSGSNSWIRGINAPEIYTSSIMIDIGTIVNTGVESLAEWLIFPFEDEQSLSLCLSPIMKFYRDLTTFIVNTIKRELGCSKYELVDSYIQYILDIISVLCRNGIGINGGSSFGSSVIQELKNLVKIHKIPNLVRKILSFSSNDSNTGIGNTGIVNMMNNNNMSYASSNIGGISNIGGTGEASLGIGSGNRSNNGSWNRSKIKISEANIRVPDRILAEKFERGRIFFNLLSLCLQLEDEEREEFGEGAMTGVEEKRKFKKNMRDGSGLGVEGYSSVARKGNTYGDIGSYMNNASISSISASCMNYVDTKDLKFLVSIHNLFFFKNIILETSSKFFTLFFGDFISPDQDQDHDLEQEGYRNQDQNLQKVVSLPSKSKRSNSFLSSSVKYQVDHKQTDQHVEERQQYKLADEVLLKMKKMLEFLRSYGAMDNDENKLLASETTTELNRLLFSQSASSLISDPKSQGRYRKLFLNLIEECIQNIDSLILYIFKMYCIKTISCTFGQEFYLRIYGTGLLNEIQNLTTSNNNNNNSKGSYSYTSSYEEETDLSLENLIPGLNSCFRSFLSQCPNQDKSYYFNDHNEDEKTTGEIIALLISKGISTQSQIENEFNKEYMKSLELLWLSHIFELSLSKTGSQSFYTDKFSTTFEYDFEILDELRRSSNVTDIYSSSSSSSSSSIAKESKQTITISDIILYFITQLLPNQKIIQHKIFKDLTLISNLNSEDTTLLQQKEKNPSQNSSNSKNKLKTKNQTNLNESTRYLLNQDLDQENARAPSNGTSIEKIQGNMGESNRSKNSFMSMGGSIPGGFDFSTISKQLSKGPPQIVSKIIKNSNSGQKKIRKFISRNLY